MSELNSRWMLLAVALLGVALLLPVASAHSTGANDWTDWTHSQLWSDDDPRADPGGTGTHAPMHAGDHGPHHAGGHGGEAAYAHGPDASDTRPSAGHHHWPHSNETNYHDKYGPYSNGTYHHQGEYVNSRGYHEDTYLNDTHYHGDVYQEGAHYYDDTYQNGTYEDGHGIENDRWHDDASNTTTSGDWDDRRRHHGPGGCR